MSPRRTGALAALLLTALVAAQPADERGLRQRTVDGWRVEDVSETDGGRMVRMTRLGGDYSLEYHRSYWRGNSAPVRGASAQRGDCMDGGEASQGLGDPLWSAGDVRAQLNAYLVTCAMSAGQAAAALRGFDRAFSLLSAWSDDAERSVAEEAAAIAAYGSDTAVNVAVEVSPGDAGAANGVEPQQTGL